MKLFKLTNEKLGKLKEIKFNKEREVQKITEDNLESVFGLKFVKSEFTIKDFRIDTLAYDEETNAFVIIEYKRGSSFSVIDQGVTYLSLMLNNKAEFILELNENTGKSFKRSNIDWSQTRIIFVADSFNQFQEGALGFKDLPIELWEAKQFEKDLILFNPVKSKTKAKASLKTVQKGNEIETVTKEVISYDLDHHFKPDWKDSRELYDMLKEKLFELYPNTTERITKFYIPFIDENTNKSYVEFVAQKQGVKVYLRPFAKQLKSPTLKVGDCSKKGHWTNGNSFVILSKEEEIVYVLDLIKQAYEQLQKED